MKRNHSARAPPSYFRANQFVTAVDKHFAPAIGVDARGGHDHSDGDDLVVTPYFEGKRCSAHVDGRALRRVLGALADQ